MKKVFGLLLAMVLCVGVLAGCSQADKVLTADEAVNVALKDLGISADEVTDAHTHVATGDVPAFSIHITVGDTEYEYLIAAKGGEILSASEIN